MLKIGNIINLPVHYNNEIQSIDMIVAAFNQYKRCDCKEDDTVLLATRYLYPEQLRKASALQACFHNKY